MRRPFSMRVSTTGPGGADVKPCGDVERDVVRAVVGVELGEVVEREVSPRPVGLEARDLREPLPDHVERPGVARALDDVRQLVVPRDVELDRVSPGATSRGRGTRASVSSSSPGRWSLARPTRGRRACPPSRSVIRRTSIVPQSATPLPPPRTWLDGLAQPDRVLVLERVQVKVHPDLAHRDARRVAPGDRPFAVHGVLVGIERRAQRVVDDVVGARPKRRVGVEARVVGGGGRRGWRRGRLRRGRAGGGRRRRRGGERRRGLREEPRKGRPEESRAHALKVGELSSRVDRSALALDLISSGTMNNPRALVALAALVPFFVVACGGGETPPAQAPQGGTSASSSASSGASSSDSSSAPPTSPGAGEHVSVKTCGQKDKVQAHDLNAEGQTEAFVPCAKAARGTTRGSSRSRRSPRAYTSSSTRPTIR